MTQESAPKTKPSFTFGKSLYDQPAYTSGNQANWATSGAAKLKIAGQTESDDPQAGNEYSEPAELQKKGSKLFQKQTLKLKILLGSGA
jgi:hypothetical protein